MASLIARLKRRYTSPAWCTYCKRTLGPAGTGCSTAATADHLIPKSMGGTRVVPCCLACNNLKGNMMPGEWRAWCAANPAWWEQWGASGFKSRRGGLPRVYAADEKIDIIQLPRTAFRGASDTP